jgi:hypothetical protein
MQINPLRDLEKQYHRQPIPPDDWTPQLASRFTFLELAITRDPVLTQFDSTLPIFLQTDWSAAIMSNILMQPADNATSKSALASLESGGGKIFDNVRCPVATGPFQFTLLQLP